MKGTKKSHIADISSRTGQNYFQEYRVLRLTVAFFTDTRISEKC